MASKFQNRLVGTIILVALGVIVLPGLLDGQKKHYQDEFAAIPLVPKPGDTDEPDMLPAATQALPSQPPEGAAEEVRAGNAFAPGLDSTTLPIENGADIDEVPVAREKPPQPKPVAEKPKPKPAEKAPSVPAVDQTNERLAMESEQPPKTDKPARQDEQAAPTGKAYVVQLGALKNADKVNEIVGKLRGAGFRVYTLPSTPVQGKVTRILVGPDASKDKLKSSLGELSSLSGLNGVVMNYTVR
ncbi:cell division protein DedD [Enterobacter sp. R1(2018)]|uniref:cell division protein DedD n=1 Tax=Enterobacter sp. R1(2018) TaxID=2447891 RepID=UPI000EB2C1C9|nr:cell division protein DedD [Enterobacter sp. R1(2018)]RKQ38439.1 cell division protein DedD [Enterobacter sp. R1(2018)]